MSCSVLDAEGTTINQADEFLTLYINTLQLVKYEVNTASFITDYLKTVGGPELQLSGTVAAWQVGVRELKKKKKQVRNQLK